MSEPSYLAPASPKSLLEQMQELLASVNADLADLGSDLEAAGARAAEPREPLEPAEGGW
ncbi:hypothetical protein ACFYNO_10270 [Kitasatospora sp. NPDC006697]|uniref:hypothetical protein n=1 Tax=Kitasatospora sp. NPDC006697 TaxID=3364020 RepID=UPI0036AD553B